MKWHHLTVFLCLALSPILALAQQSHYDPNVIAGLVDELNKRATRAEVSSCGISNGVYNGILPSGSNSGGVTELCRYNVKDHIGRDLPVSVIDFADIEKLRSYYPLAEKTNMEAFLCVARAHHVGRMLGQAGIETVKLYLEPTKTFGIDGIDGIFGIFGNKIMPDTRTNSNRNEHKQGWPFHVANMIYVREKTGQVVEYVIDPFMESIPVPKQQWLDRMSNVGSVKVMSRYNYGGFDSGWPQTEYDQKQYEKTLSILAGETKEEYR